MAGPDCATEYDRCESCGAFYSIFGWENWVGWCTDPHSPRYRMVIDRDEKPCGRFDRKGGVLRLVNNRVPPRQPEVQDAGD